MSAETDLQTGLPVGVPVNPSPARRPERVTLSGRLVDLVPLDAASHTEALADGACGTEHAPLWPYLADGPFDDRAQFRALVEKKSTATDAVFFAIVDKPSGRAVGYASLMRIDVTNRVIEVGNILYTPALQRTAGATEAMYLLARYVFEDLGYRRYEWKCNALNEPSRKAALRLGFTFEGIFRQHFIVKGRNRDTAWFSMLDSEWPAIKANFERWLAPANFDAAGRQKTPLRLASQPG
ncbi:MAG TPA: GNAT family protein [Bryobacteraceae bacterium]|nr:GNAT family protein [Bryobacteraceae bacterium]